MAKTISPSIRISHRILTSVRSALLALAVLLAGSVMQAETTYSDTGSPNPIPTGNITTDAIFDITNTATYSGVISGDGYVTKTGDGALTLTGANTFTGTTTINGGSLVFKNNFTTSSGLAGSGTLQMFGNNINFDISNSAQQPFTGTIQINDTSITAKWRVRLGDSSKAVNLSLPNAALEINGSSKGFSELAFYKGSSSLTIGTLNGNKYGRIINIDSSTIDSTTHLDKPEMFCNLTVYSGTFAGEIGRLQDNNDYPPNGSYRYVNHINLTKGNDGTESGGELTLSGPLYYFGETVVEGGTLTISGNPQYTSKVDVKGGTLKMTGTPTYSGDTVVENGGTLILSGTPKFTGSTEIQQGGTLELTNKLSGSNYQVFATSTALKGSGSLDFTGDNWTVFNINTTDTSTPQAFTGTVNVVNASKIMIKTDSNAITTLNLGNAVLNVGAGGSVGLHSVSSKVSSLAVKELNTKSGSEVRICSNNPNSGYGTLTVGRGEINGNLGKINTNWNNVHLVKASDGSANGGTLTINGNYYYNGTTTISAGTLKIVNNEYNNKNFNTSTALAGAGTLELVTKGILDADNQSWIYFSTNNAQEFSGLVKVTGAVTFNKDANLGNATLYVSENAKATLHTDSAKNLTVKVLNTDSGSTVRYSHNPASSANLPYATLTVGSGTVNGDLGEINSSNLWYNWFNLVKASDGSDDGGTLTINGNNYYTGATTIQAGTLKLTGAGSLGSGATTIAQGAQLDFGYEDDLADPIVITSANAISGSGQIVKSGSGTLKIDNINSPNTISAGSFVVNAGELDFKGYFVGSIEINNNAVFSPGNSVGTLNVTGDVIVNSGTALFEFGTYTDEGNDHDLLVLGENNTFTAGNRMISLAFDGDPNDWTMDDNSYLLVAGNKFTDGKDYSQWLGTNRDLFSLTGGSGGLYLTVGASSDPVAVVPEPSTWALLLLGAAGLMYWRKKNA
ncbi:MAG: autotransporter-associated beta strand repeat-containing protein [Thermoguttaceae bacterium]|nr:autotransporter-associated beta strand repeat-containing protein [Thermoguttaceae bacterium]